jgi:hypothetical protein
MDQGPRIQPASRAGFGLVPAQAGDRVDGLGGAALRLVQAASAAEPQRLPGVREADAGRHGQHLPGAHLAATVSADAVAGGVAGDVRDRLPGRPAIRACRPGWLALPVRIQCAPRSAR